MNAKPVSLIILSLSARLNPLNVSKVLTVSHVLVVWEYAERIAVRTWVLKFRLDVISHEDAIFLNNFESEAFVELILVIFLNVSYQVNAD